MLIRLLAALLLTTALATGCSEIPPPQVSPPEPRPTVKGTPTYDPDLEPAAAVLPFVPADAEFLTVTDFDQVRAELGVPDMTSDDPLTDRIAFWRRAEVETPMLTDGMLRDDNSELMLDFGFTQDDVDWEAHFVTPDDKGFVLAFRDDLDMFGVTRAVARKVGPLAGATVLPMQHLVVSGVTDDGNLSWAKDLDLVELVGDPAEATYVRRSCVPFNEALGPEVDAELQARALAVQDPTRLDPLDYFAVVFGDHLATVRIDAGRTDVFDRMRLGESWPAVDGVSFGEAFTSAVADPGTGRIGYTLDKPTLAARLTLLGELPFAVCNDVSPLDEPAGL